MRKRLSDRQLEQLLQHLPGEAAAPDLALRVCVRIRQVRQRTLRMRMAASVLFGLVGMAMLAPSTGFWAIELPLPQNGLLLLWEGFGLLLSHGGSYLAESLQALLSYQGRLLPTSAPAAPGLILLAFSAILVMDLLIPREVFE